MLQPESEKTTVHKEESTCSKAATASDYFNITRLFEARSHQICSEQDPRSQEVLANLKEVKLHLRKLKDFQNFGVRDSLLPKLNKEVDHLLKFKKDLPLKLVSHSLAMIIIWWSYEPRLPPGADMHDFVLTTQNMKTADLEWLTDLKAEIIRLLKRDGSMTVSSTTSCLTNTNTQLSGIQLIERSLLHTNLGGNDGVGGPGASGGEAVLVVEAGSGTSHASNKENVLLEKIKGLKASAVKASRSGFCQIKAEFDGKFDDKNPKGIITYSF